MGTQASVITSNTPLEEGSKINTLSHFLVSFKCIRHGFSDDEVDVIDDFKMNSNEAKRSFHLKHFSILLFMIDRRFSISGVHLTKL